MHGRGIGPTQSVDRGSKKRHRSLAVSERSLEPPQHGRVDIRGHPTSTFLRLPNVEATNYRAEQAIRPSVVNRIVWGGNRTDTGVQHQPLLTTVLTHLRPTRPSPLDFLAKARQAHQSIPLLDLTR
jgi:hypothetical protein